MPTPAGPSSRAVRLRELFALAVETPPEHRNDWLIAQTGDDPSLLDEVRALLAAHAESSGLFSSPAPSSVTAHGSPLPTSGSALTGRRVGHYRLDAWIGAGGMGEVFKAWDLALDRPAAVKLIRSDAGSPHATRLLAEVAACAQLQHPAIATFFEGGEEGGTAYLAMEFVEGMTLRQRLATGSMTSTDALTVATGLLEALAHAHAAGLLHRDIKPENVMLTGTGQPKLLDFGIARQLSATDIGDGTADASALPTAMITADGGAAGTPGYMSPEQLRGEGLTLASDVFQVGALLFEMLTGRRAFGEGSSLSKIAATLAGPPDFSPLAHMRPSGLSPLVARALAVDPRDRFESAAAFLRAVDVLVDGRLRRALPDSIVIAGFEAALPTAPGGPVDASAQMVTDRPLDWIGRALSDTLAHTLARRDNVSVVSASSVARAVASARTRHETPDHVGLALTLGARWVVAGRYSYQEDRLRVSVRLVDASTAIEMCVSEVTGTLDEVLSRPEALAASVVEALALQRADPEPMAAQPRPRAAELHQQARQLWQTGNRDAHPRVFALLDETLSVSPDLVPALSLLAAAHATSFIASRDPADLTRALAAADRAISLDPRCAEAWSWRAYALLRQQRVEEALASYEQATQAGEDPTASYLYGTTLASLGRFEAALPQLQHALMLEPRHGIGWLSLGWTLHALRREEAARFALGRAKALEGQPGPTFVAGVGGYIAECSRSLGELDRARADALGGLASIERSDHSYRDTIRAFCLCALGRVAVVQGDQEGARAAFAQAVAQMRGRTLTLAGGHVFVQALAGLARASGDRASFSEGLSVFESRTGYSFHAFIGCTDDVTAFELALAADSLSLGEESRRLLARARAAGSRQSFGS